MTDFSPELNEALNELGKGINTVHNSLTKLGEQQTKLAAAGATDHEELTARVATLEERPEPATAKLTDRMTRIESGVDVAIHSASEANKQLEQLASSLTPPPPDRAALYAALAKAQGEIQAAEANKEAEIRKKDDYNVVLYTFKYADLAACLEVIRKPLSENGLALIQIPSLGDNNAVHMRTVLGHESGQTISCEMTMFPEKAGPQAIGTVMAYLRRYSLCSLIGVAQFDDDAASSTKGPDEYDRITTAEAEQIIIKADELCGARADEVIARMLKGVFGGITVVGDIRAGEAKVALINLQNAADLIEKKAKAAKKKDREDRKAAESEK